MEKYYKEYVLQEKVIIHTMIQKSFNSIMTWMVYHILFYFVMHNILFFNIYTTQYFYECIIIVAESKNYIIVS